MRYDLSLSHGFRARRFAVLAAIAFGLALSTQAIAETVLKFGVASVNEGLLPLRGGE